MFDFCLKHKRSWEFRNVCEHLRRDVLTAAKYASQPNAVNLSSPETQRLYLETRFMQLRTAADLEMWQEAYRSIEDISESMRLAGSLASPALMRVYYEKLAAIFWASENLLFHGYSMLQHYILSTKEASAGEQKASTSALADGVVLAALAVPPADREDAAGEDPLTVAEEDGSFKLAQMLGFKKETPSRVRLLDALKVRFNVLVIIAYAGCRGLPPASLGLPSFVSLLCIAGRRARRI